MFENGTGEAMDYVAYYRVSTAGQARSGLGLAAQQEIVSRFVKPGDQLLAEFVEVQSGRKDNREQLWKAITLAKRGKAALVIARLDRFSRRVSFIARVMEEGVKLVVAKRQTLLTSSSISLQP